MRKGFRKTMVAVGLCAWSLGASAGLAGEAAEGPREAAFEAPITEVTVHTQGRARVTRGATVALAQGRTALVSAALPARADLSSVTATFTTAGGRVKVDGVEVRTRPARMETLEGRLAEFERERKAQEDAVFAIQQEIALLDGEKEGHAETLEMLKSFRATMGKPVAGKDGVLNAASVAEWSAAVEMSETNARRIRADLVKLASGRREAEARLAFEQRKLRDLNGRTPRATNETRVWVTLNADAATEGRLAVHYEVAGAMWSPSYRVGADMASKKMTVDVYGEVVQSTGEDWVNAALRLSTARPDLGADVPTLEPWTLTAANVGEREGARARGAAGDAMAMAADPLPAMASPFAPLGPGEAAAANRPAAAANGTAAAAPLSGRATVFAAEGLTRVPSDNQSHRIQLASFESDFALEHIVIPKIQPYAFMRASTVNTAAYPLLPGVVEVNVGDDYMGRARLALTPPGETFKLGIGRDENVYAELKPLPEQSERRNRGDNIESLNVFDLHVTNATASAVKLTVLDQLPVSAAKEISVTYGTEARKALRGDGFPGQMQWERTLEPGAKERWGYDFTLVYPETFAVVLRQSQNRLLRYNVQNNAAKMMNDAVAMPALR